MLRAGVIAAMLLSTCGREPAASEPTKTAASAPSASAPAAPTTANAPPRSGTETAEALAVQLDTLAAKSDPATAAELRAGAEDARAIGTHLEAMDRADETMKAIQPGIDAMARILRMQRDRGNFAADIDADAMLRHEKKVLERFAQLDRDIEASPDEREDLENAALEDIMALVGTKRTK